MPDKHQYQENREDYRHHPFAEGESLPIPQSEQGSETGEFKTASSVDDGFSAEESRNETTGRSAASVPAAKAGRIPESGKAPSEDILSDAQLEAYFKGGEVKDPAKLLEQLMNMSQQEK